MDPSGAGATPEGSTFRFEQPFAVSDSPCPSEPWEPRGPTDAWEHEAVARLPISIESALDGNGQRELDLVLSQWLTHAHITQHQMILMGVAEEEWVLLMQRVLLQVYVRERQGQV